MFRLRTVTATLTVFSLIACSIVGTASDDPPLETLSGFKFDNGELLIDVPSTGCTKSEDFDLKWDRADDIRTLAIVRTKPDVCRMMSHQRTVRFALPEHTKGAPVRVLNPFSESRLPRRK